MACNVQSSVTESPLAGFAARAARKSMATFERKLEAIDEGRRDAEAVDEVLPFIPVLS